MVEAADLFNASQYRRTVGGIAKSLGAPRVSVVAALGRQRRGRRHRRLGHLLVPVPRLARLGQAGAARRARPRPGASSRRRFTEWNAHMVETTAGSSRTSPGSSLTHLGWYWPRPFVRLDVEHVALWSPLRAPTTSYTEAVIYCVIPRELEAELYDKMVDYYGQPERDGDRRPPRRARPPARAGRRRVRAAARDPRPPPRAASPGRSPTPSRRQPEPDWIAAWPPRRARSRT